MTTATAAPRPAPATRAKQADHPRIAHRPALDGLRGLAVVGVLLYHGDRLRGGFLGVDLFFVLSGYLITALLLVEARDRRHVDLGQFWLRRARRLLPAIFALLVAVALYSRFIADPSQWTATRGDGLATLFYVANWHTIFGGAAYGADIAGRSPLEHTWSLAIEEQFYVLWPLIVAGVLAIRRSPRMVLWAASTVAALGTLLLIGLSLSGVSQNTLYLGTHTRMASIGFGAMVAAWEACRRSPISPSAKRSLDVGAPVVFVALLVAWCTIGLHDSFLYRGGLTLCGLAVAVVIWSIVQPGTTPLGRVLSFQPLRAVGLVSYGLYLWHWPIFLFLDEQRTGLDGWVLFLVRCAASFSVAWASYRFLEQPIRRSSWNGWRVTRLASIAAVVTVLALVVSAVGAPEDVFADDASGPTFTRADGNAPILAVYGDSVPYLLAKEGLIPKADDLGVSILNAAHHGCAPLGGIAPARDGNGTAMGGDAWENCIDTIPTYPGGLAQQPDIAMIMFGGLQWDAEIDGVWHNPCDPEYEQLFLQRYQAAVDLLSAAQTPIVLVRPEPVLAGLAERKGVDDGAKRADCLWNAIAPVRARSDVSVVDLQAHFCKSSTSCDLEGDDLSVRVDGVHYRHASAERLAAWLVPAVLRAAAR